MTLDEIARREVIQRQLLADARSLRKTEENPLGLDAIEALYQLS